MGKKSGGGSVPQAPDPAQTAAAQTAMNKETALWNAMLNNVNQVTPYGNLTYSQSGGGKQFDQVGWDKALAEWNASGRTTTAPKGKDFTKDLPPTFTSTINLSEDQQKILDSQERQDIALGGLGEEQIGRIRDSISSPYSYSGIPALYGQGDLEGTRKATEEALYSRLNPQFARDEEALRTRLINQGIGQGSEAYNTEFERFNQAKNDARMQAVLAGGTESDRLFNQSLASRNQNISEYDAQRNAPLNEYIGLTSGTQVTNPQFSDKSYQGAQPVDYASLINQGYQNQLGAYNAKTASSNSNQSALFGLAGTGLKAASLFSGWSDERLKENIVRIGEMPSGVGIYEYNFIGFPEKEVGVMAQELEKVIPEAVTEEMGYKKVNYAMVR